MPTLASFDPDKAFVIADHDDQRLIYLPHFRAKDTRALAKAISECTAAIVYTWQPDLIKQRLREAEHVQVEAVPESLARRFGLRI